MPTSITRQSDFPVAHANQSRILSLPMYPEMTGAMVEYVVGRIAGFLNDG